MDYQHTFQRYELKYLLNSRQKAAVLSAMKPYMTGDSYPDSTVCSLYFDTPDFLLIRRSLEKTAYKEKLRLRSYGPAHSDSTVFVELKKKYKSVVYKRRIPMTLSQAERCLCPGRPFKDSSQIIREIDYFRNFYKNLAPAVFLSCERKSFTGISAPDLRITFDENILWRREQLSLCSGIYGSPILSPDTALMEIKTAGAMPLWLTETPSEFGIFRTSFSKYGKAWEAILQGYLCPEGGLRYVS